jgi:hypothetical protein
MAEHKGQKYTGQESAGQESVGQEQTKSPNKGSDSFDDSDDVRNQAHDAEDIASVLESPQMKGVLSRYPELAQLKTATDEQQEQIFAHVVEQLKTELDQATSQS